MFIALRELRSSIGRFVLLTLAVALLVVLLLFFQSVARSLTLGITGGVENNAADVLVYSDQARRNPAASFLGPDVAERVAAVEGVAAASPVGRGAFTATAPGTPDLGGTDPSDAAGASDASGASDAPGGGEEVVVIGLGAPWAGPSTVDEGRRAETSGEALVSTTSLATGFSVGDVVAIGEMAFDVVGVTEEAAFDVSTTLYVTADDLAALTAARTGGQGPPPISWIAVQVDAGDGDARTLADRINQAVDGVDALDRAAAANELPGAGQITQSFGILYLLLFIVVTIVTGVFFLILTVQKQDSLVLLRAIGGSKWDVVKPVLIQVVFVVGVGATLGAAVAGGLLQAAKDVFGSTLDPRTTAITVGVVLALGLVAALGAIRRVLAVDPIEATVGGGGIQ